MKNYEPGTIVPVGTKIVRVDPSEFLIRGQIYTVVEVTESAITLKGEEKYGRFSIGCFAPYIEQEKQVETDGIPTYVALKDMPYVSKGSVIVNGVPKGKGITVIQNDTKFPEKLSIDHEDNVRWLLKEHPEDFKKIN